jgi:hypothetical protein
MHATYPAKLNIIYLNTIILLGQMNQGNPSTNRKLYYIHGPLQYIMMV